jgi:hypothetical protein
MGESYRDEMTHSWENVVEERQALWFDCGCGEPINLWTVQYDETESGNKHWWAVTHRGNSFEFGIAYKVQALLEANRVCLKIDEWLVSLRGTVDGCEGCDLEWTWLTPLSSSGTS